MIDQGCHGDCAICKSDFGPCSLTRSGSIFKKDDDTRTDVNGPDNTEPLRIKVGACPICHSDMHAYNLHPHVHPNSEWYCVLCGYEEDENGKALI